MSNVRMRVYPYACLFTYLFILNCSGENMPANLNDMPDSPGEIAITLPQALDNALWANPELYPQISLGISLSGNATAVHVEVGEVKTPAIEKEPGAWRAEISIGELTHGIHDLHVTASTAAREASLKATLGIGTSGVQLTDFDIDGAAATPRMHWRNKQLWLTWTDSSETNSKVWLQRIDGAGRFVGERIALSPADRNIYKARTVFGESSIGILFQEECKASAPCNNYITLVDFSGNELMAPIELNPQGWLGAEGGDIVFDGEAFVFIWRVYQFDEDDHEHGQIYWMRIAEETQTSIGPILASASGTGNIDDPTGSFQSFLSPHYFIKLAVIDEISVISFVREDYHSVLDMTLSKSQITKILNDGTIIGSTHTTNANSWTMHNESHVFSIGDEFVSLRTEFDLLDEQNDNEPRWLFQATRFDSKHTMQPVSNSAQLLLSEKGDRGEPFLLVHPVHYGVLAWTDNRSYHVYDSEVSGRIELYVAKMNAELTLEEETLIPHARFIQSSGQLSAVPVGNNTLILWLDERHGGTIFNSKPEVWFETVW